MLDPKNPVADRDETSNERAEERAREAARQRWRDNMLGAVRAVDPIDVFTYRLDAAELVRGEYMHEKAVRLRLAPFRTPYPTYGDNYADTVRRPIELTLAVPADVPGYLERFRLDTRVVLAIVPTSPAAQAPSIHELMRAEMARGEPPILPRTPTSALEALCREALGVAAELAVVYRDRCDPSVAYGLLLQAQGRLAAAVMFRWSHELRGATCAVLGAALLIARLVRPEEPTDAAVLLTSHLGEALARARAHWPGNRCLLQALGEEVGEVGEALTGLLLRLPETHKKHATGLAVWDECLDVAVVVTRIHAEQCAEFCTFP